MKTAIIVILALCLALSLWINRDQNPTDFSAKPSDLSSLSQPAGHSSDAAQPSALPRSPTMDFSGTAFSDDAWKLDSPATSRTTGLDPSAPAAVAPSSPGDGTFKLDIPESNLPTLDTPAPAPGEKSFRSLLATPDGQ